MILRVLLVMAILFSVMETTSNAQEKRPKKFGIFGLPEQIWSAGKKLSDWQIDEVIVSHSALTPGMASRVHSEGAKIYAEVALFVGKDFAEKHPDLWPVGADGERLAPVEWYLGLCPSADWYRQEKLEEIKKTIKECDVDGIWLDFIRFPCHWEVPAPKIEQSCFNDYCLRKFSEDTGIKLPGERTQDKASFILKNHPDQWTKWKCNQVTSFVVEVRKIISRTKPDVTLGIFSVPWMDEEYGGAITKIISQNFSSISRYVDVFSPMLYYGLLNRPVSWAGEYTRYLVRKTGRKVYPITQSNSLREATQAIIDNGAVGVMIPANELIGDEQKVETIRKILGKIP